VISTNWGSATDVGLVRQHNEDSFLAQFPVFLVADGMGGRAAGEVASSLTSVRFRELAATGRITVDEVNRALVEANERVHDQSNQADQLEGMGTTAVGLVHVHDRSQDLWLVFNVGDSRLYRWHQGSLEQVTTDHTEVQELLELGSISSKEVSSHPLRHVITRAIGTDASVEPDIWLLPPVPGERFLLCSDGLTGEVPDHDIASILAGEENPTLAATRLVERAVAAGGHDNVTVVVVDVCSDEFEDVKDTSPTRTDEGLVPDDDGTSIITVPFERLAVVAEPAEAVIVDVPGSDFDGRTKEGVDLPAMIDSVPEIPDLLEHVLAVNHGRDEAHGNSAEPTMSRVSKLEGEGERGADG
jgi:PPM family protein phosphatase